MVEKQEIVIISGFSGRLGMHIMQHFKKSSYKIIGLDSYYPKIMAQNTDFIKVDFLSRRSVEEAFSTIQEKYGNCIASVIHLAEPSCQEEDCKEYEELIQGGTTLLLQALSSFTVEQFLFLSTLFVYAPSAFKEKISENSSLFLQWAYSRAKAEGEELIRLYKKEMPIVILRAAPCYDDECHSLLLSQEIQKVHERSFIRHFFVGNSSHGVSYIHAEDLAEAIKTIVAQRKKLTQETLLLVGEEEVISYETLRRFVSKLLYGEEIGVYRVPQWIGAVQKLWKTASSMPWMVDLADAHYDVDISASKQLLGWKPKKTLQSTLPLMVRSLQCDEGEWYKNNGLSRKG